MPWLRAIRLDTARLILEPLNLQHATEMVAVLAASELYTFTGGEPPTEETLRARYERQSIGHSPTGDAGWLNWVLRMRETRAVVGHVQTTLTIEDHILVADIAWLVAPWVQNQGIATEASTTMLDWLLDQHVVRVRAFIHPNHNVSARLARRLGLIPTSMVVDDENQWELPEQTR